MLPDVERVARYRHALLLRADFVAEVGITTVRDGWSIF
jgi:hypothetical protein